jgi:hypothetical protein
MHPQQSKARNRRLEVALIAFPAFAAWDLNRMVSRAVVDGEQLQITSRLRQSASIASRMSRRWLYELRTIETVGVDSAINRSHSA